jgi:pyruvate ferredoxin oxidoreductase gamma subunit/2-oxoisovalerate ferredoxin oxidoreductase gamma subunit
VIASKLLASAMFKQGKFVQCFPDFGVERRGAPVAAFLRADDRFIHLRTGITEPDHILVLDARLIATAPVTRGLKPGGIILINSSNHPETFSALSDYAVHTVDANRIAVENGLGSSTAPIVNTVMSGAFLKVSALAGIESLVEAIREEAPGDPEANAAAARQAYQETEANGSKARGR